MYVQITIAATEQQQEELIALLSDYETSGFEQHQNQLIAWFDKNGFSQADVEQILQPYSYDLKYIQEKNWNEEWEQNFQPVIVADFCAVRADFHRPIAEVEHEIIITPKMSFGTGHHATTHMMIEQMRQMNFAGKNVLDFGTGTGILAILAEKLGASKIIAIDVDNWSIENATENLKRNDCSRTSLILSSQIPNKTFDIVLANINRNVLIQYAAELKNALVANGLLLISGILPDDQYAVLQSMKGFTLENSMQRNSWLSMLLKSE